MNDTPTPAPKIDLDELSRVIHLGLVVFGILALLTGFLAEDYKRASHFGFSLHKWLGLTLAFFMAWRLWHGLFGPQEARFSQWVPYTRDRLRLAGEDLLTLLRLKLPDRGLHQGLAGLIQSFGLAVFAYMAVTGALMALFLTPGHKAGGFVHALKEMHELGPWLLVGFLAIHGGAVLLHALAGDHRWRQAFFLEK
ncbi:MAG: cytochrome b/b6 domain-containing protein [Syntrophobacterales bacterium]|jgi:cytochrome b|nr:cytochrome b/b6 domain-containing protein [Syntrophobacterales bacterium]